MAGRATNKKARVAQGGDAASGGCAVRHRGASAVERIGRLRFGGWRRRIAVVVALSSLPLLTGPTAAPADDGLDPVLGEAATAYPDLVPTVTEVGIFRPSVWDEETQAIVEGPPNLYFDTYSQNLGSVALELTADDPTNVAGSAVSQCVAWTERVCRERRSVGGFVWHADHAHFHFEDFASYTLRSLRKNGRVDYSANGLVARSEKVSFCLIDSQQVHAGASPAPWYVGCNPVRQGISAGWADIYTSDLEGQQLVLPGIADGRYALVVSMDVANRIYETNDGNNRVVLILDISDGGRAVQVVDMYRPTRSK